MAIGGRFIGKDQRVNEDFSKRRIIHFDIANKRAADSVSLNIAEGSTGQSNDEFKRFLGYAVRSGIEVVGCLYLAKRRNYITEKQFQELYDFLDSLIRMLQSLRNSLN